MGEKWFSAVEDDDGLILFFIVSLNLMTTKDACELLNTRYIILLQSNNQHEISHVFCAQQKIYWESPMF